MKNKILILCLWVVATLGMQAQVIDLTTGRFNGGAVMPPGTVDDTWQVQVPGSVVWINALVVVNNANLACTVPNTSWAQDPCGSWITHQVCGTNWASAFNNQIGTYRYRMTFNLNGTCGFQNTVMNLNLFGADNRIQNVFLNGTSLGYTGPIDSFNPIPTNQNINVPGNLLNNGLNTIIVDVLNSGAWQALFACGSMTVTANVAPITNLGPDQIGCIQTPIALSNTPCQAGINYTWSTPGICLWGGCNASACVSGTYCITATNPTNNCSSTDCVNITLEDCSGCGLEKFEPKVEIKDDECAKLNYNVDLVPNPGTTITSILWDFGDGNTSNLQTGSHSYLYNGNYQVTVTVYAISENGECCVFDKTFDVQIQCECKVLDQEPVVTPLENCGCFEFSIAPIQISGTTQPTMIRWDFGDGTFGFGETVTHCYDVNGGYQVTLYITGFNGKDCCEGSPMVMGIPVECSFDCKLEPKFDWSYDHGVYQFTDLSNSFNGTNIVGYLWDFGDGTTSTDANPSHVFPGPGNYTVCLTIFGWTGEKCCYERVCADIQVNEFQDNNQTRSMLQQQQESSQSSLQQNAPNPFDNNTTIKYNLPVGYHDARIEIFTAEGKLMHTYKLSDEQNGQLYIQGNTYQPGMYVYRLVVDERILDSKRMVLLRN